MAVSDARSDRVAAVLSGDDRRKGSFPTMSVRTGSHRGRKVWVVQVCKHGKNIRRYLDRRQFLKADARELEARIVDQLEKGLGQCINRGGGGFSEAPVTFRMFSKQFLALQDASRPDFRNKRRDLERHLAPFFDATPLKAINRLHIDKLKAHLRVKPAGRWKQQTLRPKSINNILGTLKTMLNVAFEYELIDRVPVIRMEKVPKRDPEFLTEEQACDLIAATPPEFRVLVAVAVFAGLRRGELLELRWKDIYLDAVMPYIRVRRAIDIDKGAYIIKETKGNACRSVPCFPDLLPLLHEHRPACFDLDDLVFVEQPARTASGHLRERVIWETVDAAAQAAGIRRHVHPHLLRHTFASLALQRGAPLAVVQEWLGHANISTTERYAHLSPSTGDQYVRSMKFSVSRDRENSLNVSQKPVLKTSKRGSAVNTAVNKNENAV